ncbi:MAG: SDR family NAD(P)-dependent oxidoreductase [Clostridia bacterium]|nr:SDR family NAD(P)-dependent oxidoreductase [Clostridia bacterium]
MKYALVTGAAGGMGKACADRLLEEGFFVFALDILPLPEKERLVFIKTDLTNAESIQNAYAAVSKLTPSLHAIFHFAGVYMLNSLLEIPHQDVEKIFSINVMGATLVNSAFFPLLTSGSRIIITTSELAPLDPLPFTGIYAVTKAALDKYAYSLRMELQLKDIHVSVLRAGAVDTGMLGVSTRLLDTFVTNTTLYTVSAKRFKKIVETVEARRISPKALSNKAVKILKRRRPRFSYSINRNPLLLMLNLLPHSWQFLIIRLILK